MPTIGSMVRDAEQNLAVAKAEATLAREDSKASPEDRRLRLAAELRSEVAAKCGRDLAFWQFTEQVEIEFGRIECGDSVIDPVLEAVAPRLNGSPDHYWLAAANLVRRGIATAPPGWRSYSGEPINVSIGANQAGAARISA